MESHAATDAAHAYMSLYTAPEVNPAPASLLERVQQMVNTFKSLKTNEQKSAFLGLETALVK